MKDLNKKIVSIETKIEHISKSHYVVHKHEIIRTLTRKVVRYKRKLKKTLLKSSIYHIVVRNVKGEMVHGAWIMGHWYKAKMINHTWIIDHIRRILMELMYHKVHRKYHIKIVHGAWINGKWYKAHKVDGEWIIQDMDSLRNSLHISNESLDRWYRHETATSMHLETRWHNGKTENGCWIQDKWHIAHKVDGKWVVEQKIEN